MKLLQIPEQYNILFLNTKLFSTIIITIQSFKLDQNRFCHYIAKNSILPLGNMFLELTNICYTPNLKFNLISSIYFSKNEVEI